MNFLNNGKRYFIISLFLTFNLSHAQAEFAFIKKNINVLANDLYHDLNETKDTLILKSTNKMYRVYTAGFHSGTIDQHMIATEFKVPLNLFERGKYVFCVDQLRYKIVFTVFILKGQPLQPGEFLMDSALAYNMKKNENQLNDRLVQSRTLIKESTKVTNTEEKLAETAVKTEHGGQSVFENFDVLRDAAKLKNIREPGKAISKIPISKNIRTDKLSQLVRSSPRAKTIKKPVLNPNYYNLTDLNRNGVQSREEARKIMAAKRKKIRDSIKNRIKDQQ